MKEVLNLLNSMVADRIISDYALFGAVAQMRYTEAVSTLDADVLVSLPSDAGLDVLSGIYNYCKSRGYQPEGEAILVGDWPVQFIPVFSPLSEEALRNSERDVMDGVPVRVVSADYLAAMALSVGRSKDHLRILSLIEAGAVSTDSISAIAARHGLDVKWCEFKRKFINA
ncbi:MAG TPA: hypothetical protein PLH00_06595 [Bacteroidaceae bacterium]|nr:hypothetical protein [Bacteroidaceae bacterium]